MALFLMLVAPFVSCKKTKELLDVSFSFSTNSTFTLPKISSQEHAVVDSVVTITTPDITNTIPDEFKKNNADINKVKSISVQSLSLAIQSPSGQTFAFMKSIKIYLGASGLGEVLIASEDNINTISPAPTTLDLSVANADIVKYIKNPTYYLKIETALVKTYTQDIVVASTIGFKAVANPIN
jgi:hypothetical protein